MFIVPKIYGILFLPHGKTGVNFFMPLMQTNEEDGKVVALPEFFDTSYYLNRELSWLSFNQRVL